MKEICGAGVKAYGGQRRGGRASSHQKIRHGGSRGEGVGKALERKVDICNAQAEVVLESRDCDRGGGELVVQANTTRKSGLARRGKSKTPDSGTPWVAQQVKFRGQREEWLGLRAGQWTHTALNWNRADR